MTKDQIIKRNKKIVSMYKTGLYSTKELGKIFNLHPNHIATRITKGIKITRVGIEMPSNIKSLIFNDRIVFVRIG